MYYHIKCKEIGIRGGGGGRGRGGREEKRGEGGEGGGRGREGKKGGRGEEGREWRGNLISKLGHVGTHSVFVSGLLTQLDQQTKILVPLSQLYYLSVQSFLHCGVCVCVCVCVCAHQILLSLNTSQYAITFKLYKTQQNKTKKQKTCSMKSFTLTHTHTVRAEISLWPTQTVS